MKTILFPEHTRWKSELSWLRSNFSFSFADYYNPERMWFWTLRVINDDWIAPAKGFWMHPHANMEIITIPLQGSISHKDSMGNAGIVGVWEVQSMSAGSGVHHSEMNHDPFIACELFQIWIHTRENGIDPQYSQAAYTLKNGEWTLLSGPIKRDDVAFINQDAYISRRLAKAGESFEYPLQKPENILYIMNISGSFRVENNSLEARDAIGILEIKEKIEFTAQSNCDILVIEVPQV